MKTSDDIYKIHFNTALDSNDCFTQQKVYSIFEINMNTHSHIITQVWHSTYYLCGPCNKFQFVYHIQFPILKEVHPQHNRQRSMALLSCKINYENKIESQVNFA